MKSAIESDKSLLTLITKSWNTYNAASYIRGLRISGKDSKEIVDELKFLEVLARIKGG